MSRSDCICYVEGVDNDQYFYSQITSPLFKKSNLGVEYQTANNLSASGAPGGKEPLINFFKFLKSSGSLSTTFKGKKTTFAFMLDKDVDDFRSVSVKSKHIFYTEHYDLQNYLFAHGDVANAAASGASLPVEVVLHTLGEKTDWLNHCNTMWKDWVTICLFLRVHEISLGGYAEASRVNTDKYGPKDQVLLDQYKALAHRKSGLDQTTFDFKFAEVERLVNDIYATGNTNKIFKGKWYLHWLENHLSLKHSVRVSHKSLACILASNLDWNGEWTKKYKTKMVRIIKAHKSLH